MGAYLSESREDRGIAVRIGLIPMSNAWNKPFRSLSTLHISEGAT
jgi:hypothetical protein